MTNLTQPRYLVIADYPNSPFNVGNILTQYTQFNKTSYWVNDNLYTDRHPEDYTHIFRLLHWWEFRDEKDMPEYLKYQIGTKTDVCKVIGYKDGQGIIDDTHVITLHDEVLPATLNEYNEYIKNK